MLKPYRSPFEMEQMKHRMEEIAELEHLKQPQYDVVQKPEHYHMYNIDTITFLKEGFSPAVYKGFCLGNVIKYSHRYELKNGIEDLEKAYFYLGELIKMEKQKDRS